MRWIAVAIVLTLIFGVNTYAFQTAEGINPIRGYVSSGGVNVAVEITENGTKTTSPETEPIEEPEECGDECLEEQEVENPKTETTKSRVNNGTSTEKSNVLPPCRNTPCMLERAQEQRLKEQEAGVENKCNTTACLVERATLGILSELGLVEEKKSKLVVTQQIITIKLSNGCETAHRNNVTTICPSYKELMQFDNTDERISGYFVKDDTGFFHRANSHFEKHCNFYQPQMFPLVIVVDPDNCWEKEKGAYNIVVNAIKTEDFKYLVQAEQSSIDQLRKIQNRETSLLNEEQRLKNKIDAIELKQEQREDTLDIIRDKLVDFDEETRDLYEASGSNSALVQEREDLRRDLEAELNYDRYEQRIINTENEDYAELLEDYDKVIADKKQNRLDQSNLRMGTSEVITNNTVVFGIGRSIDEQCRNASVGTDLEAITQTINDMLNNCDSSSFKDREIMELEQTPVNIADFAWYKYKSWVDQVMKDCTLICKEY